MLLLLRYRKYNTETDSSHAWTVSQRSHSGQK
jgi:hypothetical protein